MFEVLDGRARLHDVASRRLFHPELAFGDVVFILDLAQHLFDQVFERDKAVDPAVFVDHQRHVDAVCSNTPIGIDGGA